MVVKRKSFEMFLESVSLCKNFEITDLIVDIDRYVQIGVLDRTRIVGIKGKYNDINEQIGTIGIGDLKLFRSFVSSFQDEELEIKRKDNKLLLSSKKDNLKASYMLTNPEYIKNSLNKENQKKFNGQLKEIKKDCVTISKSDKNKLIKYLTPFKTDLIRVNSGGKKINFSVENNEHELVASIETEKALEKMVVDVSSIFVDILKYHDGDYTFNLQDGKPIYLGYEKDCCSVDYLIAPSLVESD